MEVKYSLEKTSKNNCVFFTLIFIGVFLLYLVQIKRFSASFERKILN